MFEKSVAHKQLIQVVEIPESITRIMKARITSVACIRQRFPFQAHRRNDEPYPSSGLLDRYLTHIYGAMGF